MGPPAAAAVGCGFVMQSGKKSFGAGFVLLDHQEPVRERRDIVPRWECIVNRTFPLGAEVSDEEGDARRR